VPHLLCDLHKEIAKRCVLLAIQHQMLTVSKSTARKQQWQVFRVMGIGIPCNFPTRTQPPRSVEPHQGRLRKQNATPYGSQVSTWGKDGN